MITASAPGKLLLFGEHAVLYGAPCIVTAVDRRLQVSVQKTTDDKLHIDTPGVDNADFVKAALVVAKARWGVSEEGISIKTNSEFSHRYGLGSSAATAVATLQALVGLMHVDVSARDLFDAAYEAVLSVQKKGSGFDVAASVFGGTFCFTSGGGSIEPIALSAPMPLVVGYTGVKASTVPLVDMVAQKRALYPEKVDRIMKAIGTIVDQVKPHLVSADWERVGTLMNFNHEYLRDLGVSSELLEKLISAAKEAGAYGAKLSGAGGGDCMIAIAPPDKIQEIGAAIASAGGEVARLATDAPGVSLETTDDESELFIVVDKDDAIVGYKSRRQCHRDRRLIHRSVNILLYNTQGQILLQKRSKTKDTYPGAWTVSASGHVARGEEYEQAARRELKEELGVDAPIKLVTKFIYASDTETEMESVFGGTHDGPFNHHPQEVSEVRWVSKNELPRMLLAHEITLTPSAYEILKRVKFI